MPRISEQLELGTTVFKAVRPQNAQTPAQFRQSGVSYATAKDLNLGVQITKTASRSTRRGTTSLTIPVFNAEGVLLYTDRIDIKTRFDALTPDATVEASLAEVAALVVSNEFKLLAKGEEQF